MKLQDKARSRIEPHLQPGETILWCQAGPMWRLSLPLFIPLTLVTIWTGATFWAFCMVVAWSLRNNASDWTGAYIAGAMSLAGFLLLLWLWRDVKAGAKTAYAVTDRAAIIVEDVTPRLVRRFGPEDVAKRRRLFDRIAFQPDVAPEDNPYHPASTFIGVRNIKNVELLLDQLVRRKQMGAGSTS